ncbi:hypothetical protein ACE5SX_11770 [Lactiplantibacillus plantarum]|uniref:hypothetical protein n=1 Tax=Lactiplantibacillus plantarum TaxID=1590 RepID=UPI000FF8C388|nr:hypothetical protein [Lactiplantibacillus plantarum]MDG2544714.1 hypothetical protein [Lactiplantibacillus plantarum]QAS26515.1 hypothetical protein EQK26_05355 [Lactiplantibacillus plantarum]
MAKYSKPMNQVLNDLTKFTDEDRDSMLDFFSSIGFPIIEDSEKEPTADNFFQPVLELNQQHIRKFDNVNWAIMNRNSLAA